MSTISQHRPRCVFALHEPAEAIGTVTFIHPGGLPRACYDVFARQLPRWRVLVVELGLMPSYHSAFDRKSGRLVSSIEVIATELADTLKLGDEGRVVLGGWSFGGVICAELIHQLQRSVQAVVLFDSIAPIPGNELTADNVSPQRVLGWFVQFLNALKHCNVTLPMSSVEPVEADAVLLELLDQAKAQGAFRREESLDGFRKLFTTFIDGLKKHSLLGEVYRSRTFDAPALMFRSRLGLQLDDEGRHAMGWDQLATRVVMHVLEENHYSLMANATAVEQMARHLQSYLEAEQVLVAPLASGAAR